MKERAYVAGDNLSLLESHQHLKLQWLCKREVERIYVMIGDIGIIQTCGQLIFL